MPNHKTSKRKCPVCKEVKTFQTRNATCSQNCAWELNRQKLAKMERPEPTDPVAAYKAKRDASQERARLAEAMKAAESMAKLNRLVQGLMEMPTPAPPAWVKPVRSVGSSEAIPTAFLSDAHFDEVVFPERVEHLNEYNRQIAEARLSAFFRNTASIARDYLRGLKYPGIVVPMGGDMFSGDIHEELKETNEATLQESVYHWLDPMIAGLKFLASEFGRVYVPCVVGNHPRGTKKPSHKMRVPNNMDWLYCALLAKFLADDKRITFAVSQSADIGYSLYSTRYRLTHGDQFRGGSGIAGLLSPLMIGDARKSKRARAVGNEYDYLLLGHWHQRASFKSIIVNGSLKGYDEYAYDSNFDYQPPEQSFWLTDPAHGITISAPIHLEEPKKPRVKSPAFALNLLRAA